jgi:hypothetical protein
MAKKSLSHTEACTFFRSIQAYIEAFERDGTRITENLDLVA